MNYYEKHISDYRRDTTHLSLLEHGVYNQLLDTYYLSEMPLTSDLESLMRTHCARTADERQALVNVLKDFFTLSSDGYIHDKCQRVLERIYAKSDKARASADARWAKARARKINGLDANALPSQSEGNANGMLPNNPVPSNPSKTLLPPAVPAEGDDEGPHGPGAGLSRPTGMPRVAPTPGASGERFDDFWKAWPKNERKQDKAKCLAKWKRGRLDLVADTILADIAVKRKTQKWIDGFVEAPLVYLNGSRWEDGVQPQEPGQEAQTVQSWLDTRGGVEKRAAELFLPAWTGIDDATGKQIPWAAYRATVIDAAVKAGEVIS